MCVWIRCGLLGWSSLISMCCIAQAFGHYALEYDLNRNQTKATGSIMYYKARSRKERQNGWVELQVIFCSAE